MRHKYLDKCPLLVPIYRDQHEVRKPLKMLM